MRRIASIEDLFEQLAYAIVRADSFMVKYFTLKHLEDLHKDYEHPRAGQEGLPLNNTLEKLIDPKACKAFKAVEADMSKVKTLAENGRFGVTFLNIHSAGKNNQSLYYRRFSLHTSIEHRERQC